VRYVRPNDLDEALAALADGGVPLAGGSVLVPLIARGAVAPSAVVDVGRLEPLRELRDADGELRIGSAVTLEALERVAPAGEAALSEAAARVGSPLVRRVGTVGGNVASRLPTADLVPPLLALDANLVWAGDDGPGVPLAEVLAGETEPGRLLVALRIRREPARRSGFVKFAWRRSIGTPVASVAFAALRTGGTIDEPRVAIGGLAAPRRLPRAEAVLAGRPWADPPIEEAAAAAADEASSLDGVGRDDTRPQLVALGLRRLLDRLVKP
jgi:CO/xanthine dehydrogenase FAD-binding subunit